MTGAEELHGAPCARRSVVTFAALSLAASACDTTPPDDAPLAALSGSELVALCDELRDSVADQPIQCEDGERYWVLPSNQSCRDADLTNCTASAGDARGWHEQARSEACSQASDSDPSSVEADPRQSCDPFRPQFRGAEPQCPAAGLTSLESADGVYELVLSGMSSKVPCNVTLPEPLDRDAARLVLVATQASGTPEVILKSCGEVADCLALAREIRTFGDAQSADPDAEAYNHLVACDRAPGSNFEIVLNSRVPEGVPFCQVRWLPRIDILRNGSGLTILVSADRPIRASAGCGYVVAPSSGELEACYASGYYEARFVSAL